MRGVRVNYSTLHGHLFSILLFSDNTFLVRFPPRFQTTNQQDRSALVLLVVPFVSRRVSRDVAADSSLCTYSSFRGTTRVISESEATAVSYPVTRYTYQSRRVLSHRLAGLLLLDTEPSLCCCTGVPIYLLHCICIIFFFFRGPP